MRVAHLADTRKEPYRSSTHPRQWGVASPADLREALQVTLGGTYVFERELGGGGMARVFVARETALARNVVIKVLPPEATGAVSVDRFRREISSPRGCTIRMSSRCTAPARRVSSCITPCRWSKGESLRQRLSRDGALPVSDAVRLLRDIADALCYAHEQRVVHRDLTALVMRLLSKRPEDRPSSAEEVLRELEAATPSGASVRLAATPVGRARWAWLASGGLLAVLAFGVTVLARQRYTSALPSRATTELDPRASDVAAKITSVAVLPLANVGGDTAQEYFADGMTDELTGALGRVAGLRVASRTSAYAFKAKRESDVREIGRRLNVDAILEGTLRRAGDRLRVSAQLTSTRDGLALWSGSYERRVADVFAVQDDLARAITTALEQRLVGGRLGVVEPTRQYDLGAYDLFLRAQFFFNKHTGESLRRSIGLYEAAIARDSTLAPRAWFGINKAWTWLADDWEAPTTAWPKARTAGLNALAADSSFQPARTALGLVLLYFDRDFAGAERMIRAARAHDSTAGQYDLGDVLV